MSTENQPEIILYDLACVKNLCFSPVAWRIRMILNYKKIPHRTIFIEFPDIEPTMKALGLPLPESETKYTVPAIQHVPSNTYMMGSDPISEFLESNCPEPALNMVSELGTKIQTEARTVAWSTFRNSVMPREYKIFSPRSQQFFRRTREATLGHPLFSMEENWRAIDPDMQKVNTLLLTNSAQGPFILGEQPSYADFFIAGVLQCARTIEESVFQRLVQYPGFDQVYNACLPFMEKRD
ncbi:uncharacterized protein N7483_007662 [Penicillium malachiteum]|uniref:uncharacterized protein n=1 Tax=Penicillium malachiteum TaxID=1324776 RepID=UPI002548E21A|nr:uncharacterized protein N7483_007662 [Penicillium malachiteum]KAJ5726305.1 hypothetical protein N7483_007662 [Penicillium malachiteum]